MPDRVKSGSMYDGIPTGPLKGERFDTLVEAGRVIIERIISTGQASADWYDQPQDEWVMILEGTARLRIEGEDADRELGQGDWLFLPARCRHKVTWTQATPPTVWLAVHIHPA